MSRPRRGRSVLAEAARLVAGPRRNAYGTPRQGCAHVAALWSALLGQTITAEEVALMLLLLKVARERHRHQRDNLVDMAGYVRVLAEIVGEER